MRTALTIVASLAITACASPAGPEALLSARTLGILQLTAASGQAPSVDGSYGGQVRWYPPLESREAVLLPTSVIAAPDTVLANQPFLLTVGTIGLDGCWAADGGDVMQHASGIDISPYDARSGAALCTAMSLARPLLRQFTVALATPGTHTIRVHGRRATSADGLVGDLVTAERTVVAR